MKIQPTRLEVMQEETKTDSTLSKLKENIIHGWPQSMQDLPQELHPYWCMRDELGIIDGLVLKGHRVVVPTGQRMETLARLHDAHQGLASTLHRARRTVYWPKIQDDIADMIDRCTECQVHARKKPKTSERQLQASRPLEIVAMDLMEINKSHFLVAVDYYSGYLTMDKVSTLTSDSVIKAITSNCQKFGLCETILTDNGPCFSSEKFATFCHSLDAKHITSSPHYHQSNGRAERAIQTIRQICKKSKSGMEVMLGLIAYHDTPISESLPSPAELFFGRRINSRLGPLHQPSKATDGERCELSRKRAAHLRPAKPTQFTVNQPIWYTEDGSSTWKPGFISETDTAPHSYWIVNEAHDRRLRRNKHDLKPRIPVQNPTQHVIPGAIPIDIHDDSDFDANETSHALEGTAQTEPSNSDLPMQEAPASARTSRYGRKIKSNQSEDFVYS